MDDFKYLSVFTWRREDSGYVFLGLTVGYEKRDFGLWEFEFFEGRSSFLCFVFIIFSVVFVIKEVFSRGIELNRIYLMME